MDGTEFRNPDTLMNEVQAADFLSVSPRTLQAWRVRGGGPAFIRARRSVRYRFGDIVEWINQRRVSHTSEAVAR